LNANILGLERKSPELIGEVCVVPDDYGLVGEVAVVPEVHFRNEEEPDLVDLVLSKTETRRTSR